MSKKGGLLAVLLMASMSAVAGASTLPFINDNYAKGLAAAKQRNLPMFVEVSAAW